MLEMLEPNYTSRLRRYGITKKIGSMRNRKLTYHKIIEDRRANGKVYQGLKSKGLVFNLKEDKSQGPNKKYFLTLKGCLLTMGYDFSDGEFEQFITNASRISLFFAYIHTTLRKTSVSFVKQIFFDPVRKLLKKNI